MKSKSITPTFPIWGNEITNREAKQRVAAIVAAKARSGDVIGVGSGSTSYLTVLALGERIANEGISIITIPTSSELAMACSAVGITVSSLLTMKPDWAFDGADEVDPRQRLIKGRGGALLQEKAVMAIATKTYIVVDDSKFVSSLGSKFAVPVETVPFCVHHVVEKLRDLGSHNIILRMAKGKDGPVITEGGNFLLDARFENIEDSLEASISAIVGVVESGLFINYPVEIIRQ